ncbi:class I SAM-dependent methyltransferase [Acrocarpospora catenulata]|uniref:class I SAM-dependent methyltransferase n=1 Tax=Acrocarpospora catenulata TaxID=2836182 RepID=UPI001BDAF9D1|nr:class I SAM-dependent methyltransferase [Acrocarpospora catenulata]
MSTAEETPVIGPGRLSLSAARHPNGFWYVVGLGMGLANAVRHRRTGYRRPRPYTTEEVTRSVNYVVAVVDRWEEDGVRSWRGMRVLELGPGPDLGTGAVILARGAASYTAVDLFPLAGDAGARYYEALGERLGGPVDLGRLGYHVTAYPGMPGVDGPFDVVVSSAALEHFEDVPGTFARLAELAAPGATMVHHVDGMVHMRGIRPRDPLNLLRYSDWTYRRMSFPGVPNRLRADDYLAAAEAAGWRARIVPGRTAPDSYLDRVRPGLARPYRNRKDLAALTFSVAGER